MDTYIVITSDMIEALDLKGNELLAFAMINGYSQFRQGAFLGSISYIAMVLNVSPRTVVNTLNSLVEKGLLDKTEIKISNVARSEYAVSEEAMQKLHRGLCKNCIDPVQNFHRYREDKKESSTKKEKEETQTKINNTPSTDVECVYAHTHEDEKKAEKRYFAPNVLLTEEEHSRLVEKFGADLPWMIERLDSYKEDNPKKKYSSDYRVLIGWVAKDLLEYKIAEQRLRNAEAAGAKFHPAPAAAPSALATAKAMEMELNSK